jgi:small nuclear ribonucleoprotein (snRNP)-like protein
LASRKPPKKRVPVGRVHAVKKAKRLVGQPVCVLLNDGSCYVGTIHAIHDHKLILSETRNCGRVNLSDRSKTPEVQVSGLLDSLIGGIGALNSFGSMASGLFKPMFSGPSVQSEAGILTNQSDSEGKSEPGAAGGGQQNGFFGSVKQMLPKVQVGLNMVKTIMPLMGMFKI